MNSKGTHIDVKSSAYFSCLHIFYRVIPFTLDNPFVRHWHLFACLFLGLTLLLPALALFDGLIEYQYDWNRKAWGT